jgi:hypothetical protein
MAPSLVETQTDNPTEVTIKTLKVSKPLRLSGALEKFESFDVTPVIGREYPKLKVVDLLNAPNSDDLLRDLAITS